MIPSVAALSASAICEQATPESRTPRKRKIKAIADQRSEPEAR